MAGVCLQPTIDLYHFGIFCNRITDVNRTRNFCYFDKKKVLKFLPCEVFSKFFCNGFRLAKEMDKMLKFIL